MKNHDDYGIMIQLFIDDELKGQEREDLIFHLKDCASCQEDLEEAKAFSVRVRGARPQVEAPPALREKILSHMSNCTKQATSYPPVQKRSFVRPYWRPLAAAAMLLVTVSGVLSISLLKKNRVPKDSSMQQSPNTVGLAMVGRSMCNPVRQMCSMTSWVLPCYEHRGEDRGCNNVESAIGRGPALLH
jgi:hypothetical protein